MDFETRHAVTEKNELMRQSSGRFTLHELLNGALIKDLKPNPLPCHCGHYPDVKFNEIENNCTVSCNGCTVRFIFQGSYAGAILKWNTLSTVKFDQENNKLNPFIAFDLDTGDLDDIKHQIADHRSHLQELKKITSRTEKKLINLMCHWHDFTLARIDSHQLGTSA